MGSSPSRRFAKSADFLSRSASQAAPATTTTVSLSLSLSRPARARHVRRRTACWAFGVWPDPGAGQAASSFVRNQKPSPRREAPWDWDRPGPMAPSERTSSYQSREGGRQVQERSAACACGVQAREVCEARTHACGGRRGWGQRRCIGEPPRGGEKKPPSRGYLAWEQSSASAQLRLS